MPMPAVETVVSPVDKPFELEMVEPHVHDDEGEWAIKYHAKAAGDGKFGHRPPPALPAFDWKNPGNLIAGFSIVLETVQFAMFALQSLQVETSLTLPSAPGGASAPGSDRLELPESGWFHSKIAPIVYLSVHKQIFTENLWLVYFAGALLATGTLVGFFVLFFLRDVRRFGILKFNQNQSKKADETFFIRLSARLRTAMATFVASHPLPPES
eukprot:GABV01008919.1.p1 GENE.GABV01008919.1~~GABV01008919.1.p1  ORF type:complete len:243 (+),score=90.16 GABV01008919.1:96-731(+)